MWIMNLDVINHAARDVIQIEELIRKIDIYLGGNPAVLFAGDIFKRQTTATDVFDFSHPGVIATECGKRIVLS